MRHPAAMVAIIALIAAPRMTGWALAPASNGNESDYKDWQRTVARRLERIEGGRSPSDAAAAQFGGS